MKLASLTAGQFVETGGYYVKGDAGQAKYLIVAAQAADGYGDHTLANGTVAVLQLINNKINVEQFGTIVSIIGDSAGVEATKATQNTLSMRAAVRHAQDTGLREINAGAGVFKYNGLQLAYHSVNAPDLNPNKKAQRIKLTGVGQMDDGEALEFAKSGEYEEFRTVFESVDGSPAITAKTDLTQLPIRGLEIEQISLVAECAGQGVIEFDKVHTNAALSFVTIVQKSGSGHGVRWHNSYMYSVKNVFGINVADTVASTSLGMELKNPTVAGGMIDLTQVTFDSFGVNYVFGERNFSNPAEIISGITTNGVQGLRGITNFEYCKGCISSSGNIRSEQASVKGIRFFNFCRDITLTNIRNYNPTATVADIEFGVQTDTADKKNAHINVCVLGGQADVHNAGIVRWSSLDSEGGCVKDFRLFQANGTGTGTGIDGKGSSSNGFTLDLVLSSSLTTEATGTGLYSAIFTTSEKITRREIKSVVQLASAATLNIPDTGNAFEITGSTTITDIQPIVDGMELILYNSSATITDGGNLKLASSYVPTIYSMLVLEGRGGNWREKTRSYNT